MELGVFWRSLRQRWYLVLALAVLAGAATFLVAQRVGPAYEATGTVLVFPPTKSQGPSGELSTDNPYLSLGGVSQARDVLVRSLTSKSVSDEFGKEYPDTSFEVVPDYTNNAPIIVFTVEAAAPEDAVSALRALMDRVPTELSQLQSELDLSSSERVTSLALTRDERPSVTHKVQIRAAILVAAVLGGTGLLLIALIDGLLAGRRERRTAMSAEQASPLQHIEEGPRDTPSDVAGSREAAFGAVSGPASQGDERSTRPQGQRNPNARRPRSKKARRNRPAGSSMRTPDDERPEMVTPRTRGHTTAGPRGGPS